MKDTGTDAFKLGLLQLLSTGVLELDDAEEPDGGGAGDGLLKPGPASEDPAEGSLANIHGLWAGSSDIKTVRELTQAAAVEFKSLDGFAARAVAPRLQRAGLYETLAGGYLITRKGAATRADLEVRMDEVLRQMVDQRGAWVDEELHKALRAAVLAVSTGLMAALEQPELRAATQVDGATALARAPLETDDNSDLLTRRMIFDSFDRYLAAVDTGGDAGDSAGDGGDGGDGVGDGGGE